MFKEGKLYKVVKDYSSKCVGCILRYEGINDGGNQYGKPVKLCDISCDWHDCAVFQDMTDEPNEIKMVEYIDMVDFCKKLRKERKVK